MDIYPRQWHWLLLAIVGTSLVSSPLPVAAQSQGDTSAAPRQRIHPGGLPGKIVIAGREQPSAAWDVFIELASRHPRGLVVLRDDYGSHDSAAEQLLKRWQPASGTPITIIDASPDEKRQTAAIVTSIQESGSVWLAGHDVQTIHPALVDKEIRQALLKLVEDEGVLGLSGSDPLGVTGHLIPNEPNTLSLLPELHIDLASEIIENDSDSNTVAFDAPDQVRVVLPPSGAVLIQQRHMISLSDEPSQVMLAGSENKTSQSFTMQGKHRVMDHVGLRLAGRDRIGQKFPPDTPDPTRVDDGTLIIIGGGGMPEGIVQRFVDIAGGEDACILVLPTAMPDPLPAENAMARVFRRAGAGEVHVLNGRSKEIVESPESIKLFSRATGIWFGGGRQWRFVDAYLNTAVHPLMHDVLSRGGVIMGSSAGASIQAEYMARGTPIGNQDIMADGYERGLGFLPGAAVDQHFRQRDRFADMTLLVDRYPQLLGIGIDESTALIVEKEIGTVVGKGEVHFYNRRIPKRKDGPDFVSIPAGSQYDLVERMAIERQADNAPLSVSLPNLNWSADPTLK